jgi:hypothetical protein
MSKTRCCGGTSEGEEQFICDPSNHSSPWPRTVQAVYGRNYHTHQGLDTNNGHQAIAGVHGGLMPCQRVLDKQQTRVIHRYALRGEYALIHEIILIGLAQIQH